MNSIPLKFEQELIEPQRDGQERDLPRKLAQLGPAVLIGAGPENIFDVNHADHGRQVVLAKRKPGMTRLASQAKIVFERPRQAQVNDVGPRNHDPPGGLFFQVQHVFDHHALVARQMAARHAFGHDQP